MIKFSATMLANNTGDVLAAAAEAPVSIARHGKSRFVILSATLFESMRRDLSTRRAVHVSQLADDEAEQLMTDLQQSIDRE